MLVVSRFCHDDPSGREHSALRPLAVEVHLQIHEMPPDITSRAKPPCWGLMRLASASKSSAVRRRDSHMTGLPARAAKARYHAASSRSICALTVGSASAGWACATPTLTCLGRSLREVETMDRFIISPPGCF